MAKHPSKTKVDVIIPTRNRPEQLVMCVASLNAAVERDSMDVRVVICDAGSSKDCRQRILKGLEQFRALSWTFIPSQWASGFAQCVNRGISASLSRAPANGAKFICILHDDVIVYRDWFSRNLEILRDVRFSGVQGVGSACFNARDPQSMSRRADVIQGILGRNTQQQFSSFGIQLQSERINAAVQGLQRPYELYVSGSEGSIGLYAAMFRRQAVQDAGMLDSWLMHDSSSESGWLSRMVQAEGKSLMLDWRNVVKHKAMRFGNRPLMAAQDRASAENARIKAQAVESLSGFRQLLVTGVQGDDPIPDAPESCPEGTGRVLLTCLSCEQDPQAHGWDAVFDIGGMDTGSGNLIQAVKYSPWILFPMDCRITWIDPHLVQKADVWQVLGIRLPQGFILAAPQSQEYQNPFEWALCQERQLQEKCIRMLQQCQMPAWGAFANPGILVFNPSDPRLKAAMETACTLSRQCGTSPGNMIDAAFWINKYNYMTFPGGPLGLPD